MSCNDLWGEWNGDGDFGAADLVIVIAFQGGHYEPKTAGADNTYRSPTLEVFVTPVSRLPSRRTHAFKG
jgi:hypothetical protein